MRVGSFSTIAILCAALVGVAGTAFAEQGVTPSEVRFAQVAALEGPAGALGSGMNTGLRAAFEEVNRAGGLAGRKLVLEAFDDGYEPSKSVEETRKLLAKDDHIALIGPVGTPTSAATQPLATEAGWPVLGPFTGAGFLRDPGLRNVFNLRASYDAETETWIKLLADTRGYTRIGILYQDDSFGRAGLKGVEAALDRRGLKPIARGAYPRNTLAVKAALLDIRRSGAEAVVMIGAYKPVAEFIRVARKIDFRPDFITISFVGTDALVGELGRDGAGVIISQVVPYPMDSSVPVVARYTEALKALDPEAQPSFISLEGYLVGRLAIAGLEASGATLTRASYLAALQGLGDVDLDGLVLHFGKDDNQGLDEVFLTQISPEGTITPLSPEAAKAAKADCVAPAVGG
ncbi:ABC transporter substrate-binding protein [Rhodobacter maris]|uniref:Amino acid/amide ABC transporter substrate-binding protein (HAAT family) n=1 Tax=Rhodobacter maris TaxID=446682 RepID=A0A285RY10_9RHOB|nr:ABC transporter substrate-binding protein [Rhodobacter maris]SOB99338.1 amino acid/amide ABC transporter substrate-binding protein (HAAT family) [Rhodobacter maris]